jgi:competence protein ComEC
MLLGRLLSVLCVCVSATIAVSSQTADRVTPTDEVKTRVVVRASASGQTDDLGSLRPGESAELLGSVPNWHRVRLTNGIEGFVSKRWTRILSAGAPVPAAGGPTFTVDVVDVGTGLAVLVRGADFTLVYDAGSNDDQALGDDNRMLAFMRAAAPSLARIDHVILSHPHTDHVLLLPDLFAAYDVGHVWDSGRVNDICGYRAFIEAVRTEPGVAYHTAVQNGGTRNYPFTEKQCGGDGGKLPAVALPVNLSTIIDNAPIPLGQAASMTILYADAGSHGSFNENSLVVRLDLGTRRILLMGDAEAGGRKSPSVAPTSSSIEGTLLACCLQGLAADVLIVGHHGSRTSSRTAFLDGVQASTFVVSSGPMKYQTVVLPDGDVIAELATRGQLFRTDANDAACRTATNKVGPDADDRPGGCTNVRLAVSPSALTVSMLSAP